jgi:hypothetical protein
MPREADPLASSFGVAGGGASGAAAADSARLLDPNSHLIIERCRRGIGLPGSD